MAGVRVLNLGGAWAGRIAALLLAEQGADAIDLVRPGRPAHPADAFVDRAKRLVEVDLKSAEGRKRALALAVEADIVIDNMRAGAADRLGLGYAALTDDNPGLIYVALPGFASGDALADAPAWEGVIAARTGVFTDIPPLARVIGGKPVYTAIPMASAYGGVHGALAGVLGLLHRRRTGAGQRIEVPLADAVMSAMALLAADIEGQPTRYNMPPIEATMLEVAGPILRDLADHLAPAHVARIAGYLKKFRLPLFADYRCQDGRRLFVNATDHVHQTRACLEVLGLYDRLIAEGLVAGNPYADSGPGDNLNDARSMSLAARERMAEAMAAKLATRPARDWEMAFRAAGVPATVVQTSAEWLAHPPLREAGVTADLDDPERGIVRQPGRFVTVAGAGAASPPLVPRQSLSGEARWREGAAKAPSANSGDPAGPVLAGVRVLDLSNVVAGPAAGRTLAELGADVIRIDPPAPQAGPRMTMWFGIDVNQGKRAVVLDLKSAQGRDAFARIAAHADVVLHNFLDRTARSLGLAHDQLAAIRPDIVSCQISAWGGADGGALKDDPAFDPTLQSASGITARYGSPDSPVIHAVASCVDYITGFTAALGIVQALIARDAGHGGAHVRTSLAMGAQLVQFPFMVDGAGASHGAEPHGQDATGEGAHHRIWRVADGWAFLGCRPEDTGRLAAALGANADSEAAIAERARALPFEDLAEKASEVPGACAVRIAALADVRRERTVETDATAPVGPDGGSFRFARFAHPCGYATTLPLPTWLRPARTPVRRLFPAPLPGTHTRSVLAEAGLGADEIDRLFASGAANDHWPTMRRYLPL
jgi:crotonobetainyl-CoA:carnitine CoA-transferase CaiB-like acyl-CoA transferase